MAGQDLLNQRGAGTRQANDKNGEFRVQAKALHPGEKLRREGSHYRGNETLIIGRPVLPVMLVVVLQAQAMGSEQVFRGLGMVALPIQHFRQTKVKAGADILAEMGFGQQSLHRQQVVRKQPFPLIDGQGASRPCPGFLAPGQASSR